MNDVVYLCECGETSRDHTMAGECLIRKSSGVQCECRTFRRVGNALSHEQLRSIKDAEAPQAEVE